MGGQHADYTAAQLTAFPERVCLEQELLGREHRLASHLGIVVAGRARPSPTLQEWPRACTAQVQEPMLPLDARILVAPELGREERMVATAARDHCRYFAPVLQSPEKMNAA